MLATNSSAQACAIRSTVVVLSCSWQSASTNWTAYGYLRIFLTATTTIASAPLRMFLVIWKWRCSMPMPMGRRHGFAASLTARSLTHSYATAAACAGLASAYRGPTTKQVVQCSPQVPTTNSRDLCLETMTRGQIVHSPHPHTFFFWNQDPLKHLVQLNHWTPWQPHWLVQFVVDRWFAVAASPSYMVRMATRIYARAKGGPIYLDYLHCIG